MKKQNVFMNIITAAALFGCGFAVFGWVSAKHPKEVVAPADDPAPQVTLTVETLEELIEPCSKLITATDKYTNKDTLEKDTKDPIFNLHILGSTEIVHYSYIGTIQAGLNLKDVHFTIDDTSKTIYAMMPAPTVDDVVIDTSSFIFQKEKDGIFTNIEPDEFVAKLNMDVAEMRDAASKSDKVLKTAKTSAEDNLTAILKPTADSFGYSIKFATV